MARLILLLWILLYGPVSGLLQSTEAHPENPEVLQVKLHPGNTVTGNALPSVKSILAWLYMVVAMPLMALFFGILTILIMCLLLRVKPDISPHDLESGCVKQCEQTILGQQPDEFFIISDKDDYNDKLLKCESVKCISEAKPSVNSITFETSDSVGNQKTWSQCICGQEGTTQNHETSSIVSELVYPNLSFSHEEETIISLEYIKDHDGDMPHGLCSQCSSSSESSENTECFLT